MEIGDMKNIVVLRNLPSNIVEEAIVVFKDKKYAKKIKDVGAGLSAGPSKNEKQYIIKEAEMIVSSYISNIESQKEMNGKNIGVRYKRLKYIAFFLAITSILNIIINFIV